MPLEKRQRRRMLLRLKLLLKSTNKFSKMLEVLSQLKEAGGGMLNFRRFVGLVSFDGSQVDN